jgi:cysteine sulfinate desulfinase/cysteine desulfurase-like protein
MGLASRPARETLRVSFSHTSTAAEVDTALDALASAVAKLRMTRA